MQRHDRVPLLPQADKGHWQALRVLTETAAYVDMQDAAGRSVLYLASQKGYARCVEVLLAQGASCLLNDNRLMWTPIHVSGTQRSAGRFHGIVSDCYHAEQSQFHVILSVSYQLPTVTRTACA